MTPTKRMPDVDAPLTREFWLGTQLGEVRVQRCQSCGYLRWPPANVCPECQSRSFSWIPVQPSGVLLSFCVYRKALDPSFAADIPYAVGYVQLDDGPRMYGQVDCPFDELQVGGRVRARFVPTTKEVTLIHWTTANGSSARIDGAGPR